MADHAFVLLEPDEYERAKKIFDRAKHPGFVGREQFFRCATRGRACVCVVDGEDAGVCLVDAAHKVLALSVAVKHQGRGVGQALMAHLKPRWVNAIGDRVGWFEKIGYAPVGAPKVGQNGKHITQLMERVDGAAVADATISAPKASQTRASSNDNATPSPRFYTPERVKRFTTPDEIRHLLEGIASGEEEASDAMRKFAIERLADAVGFTAGVDKPKESVAEKLVDAEQPNFSAMATEELAAWLKSRL